MAAKRTLPPWMVKSDEHKCKDPLKTSLKTNTEGRVFNKVARKKRPRRRMLYWMNERELLDTALSIIKKHKVKTDVFCPVRETADPTVILETDADESSDSDGCEKTYVSDTDPDITEQDTLPYTDLCSKRASTGFSADEVSGAAEQKLKTEDTAQRTNPDHDALQLVREIFFS